MCIENVFYSTLYDLKAYETSTQPSDLFKIQCFMTCTKPTGIHIPLKSY